MFKNDCATWRFAVVKTLPIAFSYLFISMAYGLLLGQAGYSFVWAWFSSAVVYTGAFQFVLAGFLASGASVLTVCLTALFMNSRHLFYGLSFIKEFKKTGKFFSYMIFTLTDETYSLYCSLEYPQEVDKMRAMVWIAVLARIYWLAGSILGSVISNLLPLELQGVEFCLTALFVTIVIDQWRTSKYHIPALTGFGCGMVALLLLGADRFILPALMLTAALLILVSAVGKNQGVQS